MRFIVAPVPETVDAAVTPYNLLEGLAAPKPNDDTVYRQAIIPVVFVRFPEIALILKFSNHNRYSSLSSYLTVL